MMVQRQMPSYLIASLERNGRWRLSLLAGFFREKEAAY